MKAVELLTAHLYRALVAHETERNHPLPEVANEYIAAALAGRLSDIPKSATTGRGYWTLFEPHLEAAAHPNPATRVRMNLLVGERALFLLSFAREHLVARESTGRGSPVSSVMNVAASAYQQAVQDADAHRLSLPRGVNYTANNFPDVVGATSALFRYELNHHFRTVRAEIALLATPDELEPRRLGSWH